MFYLNNYNSDKENINKQDLQKKTFKNIKSIKKKKLLLSNFVDNTNNNIYNEDCIYKVTKQKNILVFKSICSNLKFINEENIILDLDKIVKIIGIDINKDGLISIDKTLYKDNKIPK